MASLEIVRSDDVPYVSGIDQVPEGFEAKVSEEELRGTHVRVLHPGTDVRPQLFEVKADSSIDGTSHAHESDEIIYVLEGELRMGSQVCGPGTAVFVPGNTLYSLRIGANGCRFLNFRPHRDDTLITKDDFVAARKRR